MQAKDGLRVLQPKGHLRRRACLSMSRALGDLVFKHPMPLVTAAPDIAVVSLCPGESTRKAANAHP